MPCSTVCKRGMPNYKHPQACFRPRLHLPSCPWPSDCSVWISSRIQGSRNCTSDWGPRPHSMEAAVRAAAAGVEVGVAVVDVEDAAEATEERPPQTAKP